MISTAAKLAVIDSSVYIDNLRERRRFAFDNYFKRILPDGQADSRGAIPPFSPTPAEQAKGYVLFARDWMEDVPVNGVPRREEVLGPANRLSVFRAAAARSVATAARICCVTTISRGSRPTARRRRSVDQRRSATAA